MGYSKIIQSGNQIELYEFERDLPTRNIQRKKSKPKDIYDLQTHTRRQDNSKRQKQNFIRLVRSNLTGKGLPVLLTLTMREVTSVEYAQKRFNVFTTTLRRNLGKAFSYIAVPEFQKRGAVHFHVICWQLPEEIIKNERKNRYLANIWKEGFVDLLQTDGSPKLASYLGKYMAKALSDNRLSGRRAYNASNNISRPTSFRGVQVRKFAKGIWGIRLSTDEPLINKTYMTQWLGECNYKVFNF